MFADSLYTRSVTLRRGSPSPIGIVGNPGRWLACLAWIGMAASPAIAQVCPEPGTPTLPLCSTLAPTQCAGGAAGDECLPLVVTNGPNGLEANQCTCANSTTTCGPIVVIDDPLFGLPRLSCESQCPVAGEECLIHVNGAPKDPPTNTILLTDLNIDDVVTCRCPQTPTYENWVIADDFNLEGCDRCECDINGDGACDTLDLQTLQGCFGSSDPTCRAADLNCDDIVDLADVTILQCFLSGGTAATCCPNGGPKEIDRLRWYGSYFDPDFEPPTDGSPPLRRPDSWLVALHRDVPAVSCPPPPPGTKPVDWCGKLEFCSDGNGLVFRPNGSSFTYNYSDPFTLLAGYGVGDEVRICGHDDPLVVGPCPDALNFVVIDAVNECRSNVSHPSRLIAQWIIPDPLVTVDPTGKVGCDQHRTFCYTADLPDACLVHNFADPGEIDPITGAIHPVPGRTYWISIQAAVGHTVDPASCTEIDTGNTATQDYWGWHTTPPGYQHIDDAYMGSLKMTCNGDWIYDWMSHLHSSQPPYIDCMDDPTKSIDMSFYLMDVDGFCQLDATQSCRSDADCDAAVGPCVLSETVHWCQPVNPGPPVIGTPLPVPFPYGQVDELGLTVADVQVNLDIVPTTLDLHLEGPTIVWRGIEHEDIGRGTSRTVDTEILAMDLTGTDPSIGDVELHISNIGSSGKDGVRSTGTVTGLSGQAFPATASFDVNAEVVVPNPPGGVPIVAVVQQPVHMTAQVWELPPGNTTFQSDPVVIPLIDRTTLQPIGSIKSIIHFIPYKGGVNIHSDVDWSTTPVEECCQPLPDGSACEQVVCPDPNKQCVPVEYECTGTCPSTGAACATDADCVGETCMQDCIITDCDCRYPDECHGDKDMSDFGPVYCTGPCENGLVCERTEIDTDVPPDGIPDKYRCDCDEQDPIYCPLQDPANPTDPCRNLQATDCITGQLGDVCLPRFATTAGGTVVVVGCDCFTPGVDECSPIDIDQATGQITCTGTCPPTIPGDCVIFADGVSIGRPTANISDPDIPPGAELYCDCNPVPPDGACCFDADGDGIQETCIITTSADCAAQGGSYHGDGTNCGTFGACCLDYDGDGVSEACAEMDSTCCEDSGGTFLGVGSACEGDLNGNGIDDACDCDVLPGQIIRLRSGNGAVGFPDTAIRVLPGTAAAPLSAFPFSPKHFKKACKMPPASIIAPNPAWLPGSVGALPSDPLAQWIGPNPNSAGGLFGQPASGLFCQEFDVCCPDITTADITIHFAADDQIGDNPWGPNNIGVYINGTAVPTLFGVGFGSEITLSAPIGGLVVPGANQMHVYLRDVFAVASGLIYSADIEVRCQPQACCFPDGRCEDLDPCCCVDLGGTPQGTGSDCTTVDCGGGGQLTCPLPSPAGVVDPCDALQNSECISDLTNQQCLPVCMGTTFASDGTLVPIAQACTCFDDNQECGPVRVVDDGIVKEFVCDPTVCLIPGEQCQIHINGSPIGASSVDTSVVPVGAEVKCRCSGLVNDPCPTELPPPVDPCGPLQSTDCVNGVAGESCLPLCVEIQQVAGALDAVATKCDCISGDACGPVHIVDGPAGPDLVCDPSACTDPLDTCQIHLNGSPTGNTSVPAFSVPPNTEVKCKCSKTPFDPCPTALPPTVDPCGALQATDCIDGVAGELCVPICVSVEQDPTGLVPFATVCDCVSGDECGPVQIVDDGISTNLVCEPTNCPVAGETCQIHFNGSPTGNTSVPADSVVPGTEVKCKCSSTPNDPCPTELPPSLDPCGTLQATDCVDGVAGETCLPICVTVTQDPTGLIPSATVCDCVSGDECGPVRIVPGPVPGTDQLVCEPTNCPNTGETCQIHFNGSPTGNTSVPADSVVPGTEVKCKCASTPNDPCPTKLPPADDVCGALQATDCADGVAGEQCLPLNLVIEQDATGLVTVATVCDCRDPFSCGPIIIDDFPDGTTGLRCFPEICPDPTVECQPHLNGIAQGASSVIVSDLVPGDEVYCACPSAVASPVLAPPPHDFPKIRYISVDPRGANGENVGKDFDIKLTLTSTLVNGVTAVGSSWWANPPDGECISVVGPTRPATAPNWDACPILHLTGCPVIPTSEYDIVAVSGSTESSPPLAARTQLKPGIKWHGDAVGSFDGTSWSPPQGVVNIDDALAAIKTWQNPGGPVATHVSVTDVHPNLDGTQINKVVNFDDVFVEVLGFKGLEFPGTQIQTCLDP